MDGGEAWQHLAVKSPVLTSPLTCLVINGRGAKDLINMDELLSAERRRYTLTFPLKHHQMLLPLLPFLTHTYIISLTDIHGLVQYTVLHS